MSIPLSVVLYDPGAGGAFSNTNPRQLNHRISSYEDALANEIGCEMMRCSMAADSLEWALAWTDELMAGVEVYTPEGRRRWDGFLFEVVITIATGKRTLKVGRSLGDMANSIVVRSSNPDGTTASQEVTNAASIARFGKKQRVLNESGTTAAEALNRAQTVLAQTAWPVNKQSSEISSRSSSPGITVELTFHGWGDTLSWLVTSATTTTTVATQTQAISLLTSYNAVNSFFSTASSGISVTGPAALTTIATDTDYRRRIAQLFSYGDTSQRRIAWGFYPGRALTATVWAGATPSTITYYESVVDGVIRNATRAVVPVWDWLPNAMLQWTDVIEPGVPAGAVASLTRKYIKRVTLRVQGDEVSGTLEPDDVDTLTEILAKPAAGGVSARSSQIEDQITRIPQTRVPAIDNPTRYDGSTGVWKPQAGGTGKVNTGTIDTGGGNINNTGGAPIDLGTGTGIGGLGFGGVTTAGGVVGAIPKWLTSSSLGNAVAGSDYAAAFHTHDTADVTTGVFVTGRLGSGTATASVFLRGDSTWSAVDASNIANLSEAVDDRVAALLVQGTAITLTYNDVANTLTVASTAVTGSGTVGRIPVWATTGTLGDSTLVKSGAGVLTLDSGAGTYTLTVPATGTATLGTGTAGRVAEWLDGNTVQASTIAKTGTGVLTLATGTTSLTLTLSGGSGQLDFTTPGTGNVLAYDGTKFTPTAITAATLGAPTGSGTTGRVAEWGSASALQASTLIKSGAGVLTLSASSTETLTIGSGGGGTIDLNGGVFTLGPDLTTSGAGSGITLSAGGAYTLTIPASGTTALGTGTSGRVADWSGTNTIQASTLAKTGTGVLTLTSGSTTMTLTLSGGSATLDFSTPTSGDVLQYDGTKFTPTALATGPTGSGATNKLAIWSSSSALTSDTNLHWDTTNNRLGINVTTPGVALDVVGTIRANGQLIAGSTIITTTGIGWDLGLFSSGVGRVSCVINGSTVSWAATSP